MLPRAATLSALAVLAFAVPAGAASAASCGAAASGMPPNAPDGVNLEARVSCDTAITGGSLTIGMNRGGNLVGSPKYAGTAGTLTCSLQVQPPGSKYQGIISCQGSLPAGTTVSIDASAGPSTCGPPTFAADLGVAFGDGTTLGPQAFPPITDCPSDGGGPQQDPGPGHNFDPGGVFGGVVKAPPSKATVAKARHGLPFTLKLGVKGTVVVTIEVGTKVEGKTTRTTSGGSTRLVAKLSASAAHKLAGHRTHAKIHVEVKPDASTEGFSTHGRQYYKLTLTG